MATLCEHGKRIETWMDCERCVEEREIYDRVRSRVAIEERAATLQAEIATAHDDLARQRTASEIFRCDVQKRLTDMDVMCEGLQMRAAELDAKIAELKGAKEEAEHLRWAAETALEIAQENEASVVAEICKLRQLFGSKRDEGPAENTVFVAEQIGQLHETKLAKRNLDLEKQLIALTRELETMSSARTRALSSVDGTLLAMTKIAEDTLRRIRPRTEFDPNPVVVANDLADAVHALIAAKKAAVRDARRNAIVPPVARSKRGAALKLAKGGK